MPRSKAKCMGRRGAQTRCRGSVGNKHAQLQIYDAAHGSMCPRVTGIKTIPLTITVCCENIVRTYINRSSQTYVRTYMRAYLQRAYMRAYVMLTHVSTYLRYVRTYVFIRMYVRTNLCAYVRTCVRTYSGYARLYTYVRTYVHMYVRTYALRSSTARKYVRAYMGQYSVVRTYVPRTSQMGMWLRPLCHRMHGTYGRIRRVMGLRLRYLRIQKI